MSSGAGNCNMVLKVSTFNGKFELEVQDKQKSMKVGFLLRCFYAFVRLMVDVLSSPEQTPPLTNFFYKNCIP